MAVRDIIQATGLPKALVARLAGVNTATVWAWLRSDEQRAARVPSPASVRKLADGLRQYASSLDGMARDLERSLDD